jgi:hypothetical protein
MFLPSSITNAKCSPASATTTMAMETCGAMPTHIGTGHSDHFPTSDHHFLHKQQEGGSKCRLGSWTSLSSLLLSPFSQSRWGGEKVLSLALKGDLSASFLICFGVGPITGRRIGHTRPINEAILLDMVRRAGRPIFDLDQCRRLPPLLGSYTLGGM